MRTALIVASICAALALAACDRSTPPPQCPEAATPRAPSSAPVAVTTAGNDAAPRAVAPQDLLRELRVIDLTHPLHDKMAFWPGGVPFEMKRLVDYDKGYRMHRFQMGENTGTHLDAPSHFIKDARSLDRIPVAELVVPAVVVDVKTRVEKDSDYQLGPGDIEAWEKQHGAIPSGALVIANTGWHRRFDDPKAYANQDTKQRMHFPGFHPSAADVFIQRGVVGIGIDTLSIDHGASTDFATHKRMLGAGKYQLENLANLDAMPPKGALVVIGVLPVKDGTQAQARVLALLPR